MAEKPSKTSLLIVGHGTRSDVGAAEFLELVERIKGRAGEQFVVEAAFLELREPGIDAAVGRLVEQGITELVTMPLLLFAAGHAKEDVPREVAAALARRGRGEISVRQASYLGCHPALVQLSGQRMNEAVRATQRGRASRYCDPREDPGTECLLLVGRGSSDDSATAEMLEFARLRQQKLKDTKVEVAFLAMARPLLHDLLPVIAASGYERVMVQPHLLFHGELVDSIERWVEELRNDNAKTKWIVTAPLADSPGRTGLGTELIEKVILDRCREAGIRVVAPSLGD